MRWISFAAGALLAAAPARADVTHVVQPGHTIEAIAHRYHVSEEAILEANHLTDGRHLKPGQTLVIPGVEAPKKGDKDKGEHGFSARAENGKKPRGHAPRGAVDLTRADETKRVRVKDSRGHVPAAALDAFEHMMRQGANTHPPDPRLVALVGVVSSHFGGKPLQVVSGYRAYTPTQYTPHSNHNYGRALDFRIDGIDNVSLYGFCLTLRNVGCGYYPNSTFVHMDVRDSSAHWVDRSGPGEPPQYDRPGVAADEGRSDVPTERGSTAIEHGAPVLAPQLPPPSNAPPVTPSPAASDGEKSI